MNTENPINVAPKVDNQSIDLSAVQKKLLQDLLNDPRVKHLLKVLKDSAEFYLVGGCLRDCLLGVPPCDLDLATNLQPEELRTLCDKYSLRWIPTGLRHQTVTILIDGKPLEITTYRGKGMTPDGAPVFSRSITEDLEYRDFTINAIALDIDGNTNLTCQANSLKDIRDRVIRSVGKADERFLEDPLRILRMIRFACTLDFKIHPATFESAAKLSNLLEATASERIRDELCKILCSPSPSEGLRMLSATGALGVVLPEINSFVAFEQNRFHKADLFEHTLEVVKRSDPDLVLRLAALFHDVGKPSTLSVDTAGERHFYRHEYIGEKMTIQILERLKFSKEIISAVSNLVSTHMRSLTAGDAGLRRILRDTADNYQHWRELKEADAKSCKISEEEIDLQLADFDRRIAEIKRLASIKPFDNLAIRGRDLVELGIKPGPIIGQILRSLHEQILENPDLNIKEKLIPLAKRRYHEMSSK